jgi:hypothetical protein
MKQYYHLPGGFATSCPALPTFTFAIPFSAENQACGPEARALRAKTIRHGSFSGSGRQFKCGMSIAECGMEKRK